MTDKDHLRAQLERARRLAAAMTDTADRDRLRSVADDYQRQIDEASAPTDEVPQGAGEQPDAISTTAEGSSDAVAASDETPTTTGEQPETD